MEAIEVRKVDGQGRVLLPSEWRELGQAKEDFRYRAEAELKEKLASALDELGRFETVAVTKEVAEASSKMGAELARTGKSVRINDVYIGATALVHKLPLVTRNRAHFARMRGVEIETY